VTLTSIVFLLLVLSVSSYLAMNKNSQITNYYPSDLLPAIRFFEKLRLDTAQLELAVYQKDKATIDRLGKDLEKRLIFFGGGGTATDDSPFKDDDFVNNGVKEVADAMLVLVRAAMEQNLNQPLSQTYKNAEKRQKVVEQKSEEVISYIVKETTSLISNGMNGIKNIILTIAVISLLISLLLGWKLFNSIDKGMSGLIVSFEKISKGDLTASADESSKDEFGELASYFNKLGRSLKTTIEEFMVTVK
jgi:methyl-accepting chemotaxis protein